MAAKTSTPKEAADVAAQLASLAGELQAAADDETARAAALREIDDFLGNIPVKLFPDLAENPAVQNFVRMLGVGDLRPGQTAKPGTLAERSREWSIKDLEQFETVTFEPRETIPITWNGITVYLQDGVECTIPKPFADIYREHRKALEQAIKHENYLLGYSNVPPDPNWIAESSATVRAFSQLGPAPNIRQRGIGPISLETPEAAGA